MRRIQVTLAVGLLLLGSLGFATGARAANTAAATTTCANGMDNTGGQGMICEVTIVNTITAAGGTAKVTIRECHGAAGAPTAACTTKTTNLTRLVTAVNQCNDSINGGGGTLRCSVKVTNNFVGRSPGATHATRNQCVGSGGGVANECDPYPATTTSATITQCNGSANGGTLVNLWCTATGTRSSVFGVTVYQCNNSANGGGSFVHCSASIVNRTVSAGAFGTAPPTSADEPVAAATSTSAIVPFGIAFFGTLVLALIYTDRRRRSVA